MLTQTEINQASQIKENLVKLRIKRKISQTQIAKLINMKQPNLAKFEKEGDPKFSTIIKYAKALGLKSIELD